MGWNDVILARPHVLIEPGEAYFLHSFAFDADDVLRRPPTMAARLRLLSAATI
jgi:imidazoleglycerol phosphate synthase glutamine amidotransferase subunit HisH